MYMIFVTCMSRWYHVLTLTVFFFIFIIVKYIISKGTTVLWICLFCQQTLYIYHHMRRNHIEYNPWYWNKRLVQQMLLLEFSGLLQMGTWRYRQSNSGRINTRHQKQQREYIIDHLKGHRHDWGQCLFTKIIWHKILIEFSQKVIQNCTNHFGKDWAINRAEITH